MGPWIRVFDRWLNSGHKMILLPECFLMKLLTLCSLHCYFMHLTLLFLPISSFIYRYFVTCLASCNQVVVSLWQLLLKSYLIWLIWTIKPFVEHAHTHQSIHSDAAPVVWRCTSEESVHIWRKEVSVNISRPMPKCFFSNSNANFIKKYRNTLMSYRRNSPVVLQFWQFCPTVAVVENQLK